MRRHIAVLSGVILFAGALFAATAALAQVPARGRDDADRARSTIRRGPAATAPTASAVSEIFFCEVLTTECRSTNSTFPVNRLRDLFVYVTWPKASGDLEQTVEFYLPDGSLYQKKATRFSARLGQPRARAVAGARPVPAAFLTTSRGTPTVVTSLPVAGTYITQRNLLGTWKVRVLLGGKPVLSGQFTLKAADAP